MLFGLWPPRPCGCAPAIGVTCPEHIAAARGGVVDAFANAAREREAAAKADRPNVRPAGPEDTDSRVPEARGPRNADRPVVPSGDNVKVAYSYHDRMNCEEALTAAYGIRERMTEVYIVGFDTDGQLFNINSGMTKAQALWLLERAKKRLLDAP